MITPFCAFIDKPAGKVGETDHVGNVPLTVGVRTVLESKVRLIVDGEYAIEAICTGAEEIVTVAVSVPAEFVAKTENWVAAKSAVGVPVITPVEVFKLNPLGKLGLTPQVVANPPEFFGVKERIATLVAS